MSASAHEPDLAGAPVVSERGRFEKPRVLIAGAGVAGLEAVLALRSLLGRTIDITVLAPDREFVYRPTSVAEPFDMGTSATFDLQEICSDQNVELREGTLAAVDPAGHEVTTTGHDTIPYDFLLVAVGTQQRDDLPGAITFHGPGDTRALRDVLADLEVGSAESVAFVVPPESAWALPLYELAMLTYEHLRARDIGGKQLMIVTPEGQPLSLFGSRAAEAVRRLLDERGIELRTSSFVVGAEPGALCVRPAGWIPVDRIVTLPALDGPAIRGLPCDPRGFISIDDRCAVSEAPDVWAAGDATAFPVKQGGIAAQQADLGAAGIAARLGEGEGPPPFRPLVRGLLATGRAPVHMAAQREGRHSETRGVARHPLWDPPGKLAARHLAPYLAQFGHASLAASEALRDVDEIGGGEAEIEAEHNAAADLALAMADADAAWRDYDAALRWLDTAERLEVVVPAEYGEKRRRWSEARVENPSFGGTGLRAP